MSAYGPGCLSDSPVLLGLLSSQSVSSFSVKIKPRPSLLFVASNPDRSSYSSFIHRDPSSDVLIVFWISSVLGNGVSFYHDKCRVADIRFTERSKRDFPGLMYTYRGSVSHIFSGVHSCSFP